MQSASRNALEAEKMYGIHSNCNPERWSNAERRINEWWRSAGATWFELSVKW
jgi:hypothetical protein